MARAALLTAGLLAIAACSSSGDAEPSPPLETEAPTSTTETPPTTEAAETTRSTTVTDTTTTETPATESPPTDPPTTIDSEAAAEIDSVVAEAFADYEETWRILRAAFEDPGNENFRQAIAATHIAGSEADAIAALDLFVSEGQVSLPPEDANQQVTLVDPIAAIEETVAFFRACETFTSPIVEAASGSVVYDGIDSYLIDVEMRFEGGLWKIFEVTTVDEFAGTTCA